MTKLKLPVGGNNPVKNKATKKAGGSVSMTETASGSGDSMKVYEDREKKYRAQSDARALAEAEEIRRDKERMRGVKSHVKMMNKACS